MIRSKLIPVLMAATALSALGAGSAFAQQAAAPSVAPGNGGVLGEVIVTATRRAESVNRVALSVSAVTSQALDQKGIRNLYDITRTVPALTFRRFGLDGSTSLAVRGIFSTAGASVSGVFLDDIPLQKRYAEGGFTGNGTPLPELFDLDRVEVLRGPQGTLFGGSSQGGAVRFITPQPSLTRKSVYVRAGASVTDGGAPSAELGAAVGGPIVEDKLGFRLSVAGQRVGGYIDHVSPMTGQQTMKDTNSEDHLSARLALRWAPTAHDDFTLAAFNSHVKLNDIDTYWQNVPAYTVPGGTFGATGAAATGAAVRFTRAPVSYPALNFYGPGKTGFFMKQPRDNRMDVVSLTYDHDFGWATLKSITGHIHDSSKSIGELPQDILNTQGYYGGYLAQVPGFETPYFAGSTRDAWTQEVRLSSGPDAGRLTWVVGAFYSDQKTRSYSRLLANYDPIFLALRGVTSAVFYGVAEVNNVFTARDQSLDEKSLAGFGEANLALTDKLKVTAGVRLSRETFEYNTTLFGQNTGVIVPTFANAGLTVGSIKETPVSPKVGVSYQLTERDLLYANVSRGFRPGGVNPSLPQTPQCASAVGLIGGVTPSTYEADYALNYEAGAKLRLFGGKAQVNSSAFYIDWSGVQTRLSLPGCSFMYVANVGKVASKGFDTSWSVQFTDQLSVDATLGYTDARYTDTVKAPAAPGTVASVIVNAKDALPIPVWNASLGGRYDFMAMGHNAYLRGDYQYTGGYKRTFSAGTTTYVPDIYRAKATYTTNLRAGVMLMNEYDLSVFVNNLFNFDDPINLVNGRAGCATEACPSFRTNYVNLMGTTYQPRTIGVTLTYRH